MSNRYNYKIKLDAGGAFTRASYRAFYLSIHHWIVWYNRVVSTKTWNDLEPPKTTYSHLQPPQKFQQPPTTTSKISTATRKPSKTI